MDEILIEDKKYVSSKRAAKVTGYAKDYVGQLCREGRVPARLVGRAWYVLESAIHDHRFGDQEVSTEHVAQESAPKEESETWESPRYEASTAETLPQVRTKEEAIAPQEDVHTSQHLQDSWKAWFDRVAVTEPVDLATLTVPTEQEEKVESVLEEESPVVQEEIEQEEEIQIPIRTVYDLPPEELLPPKVVARSIIHSEKPKQHGQKIPKWLMSFQVAGAAIAILFATLAIAGSGYLDTYILSNSQVGVIAGVVLYDK